MNTAPILDIREFEIFADGLDHAEGLAVGSDHNL